MRNKCCLAGCCVLLMPGTAWGWPGGEAGGAADLASLSLADLMKVPVVSVSKREQRQSRVPAAVFVVTQEDIRRSTATSIPELLRMVPGLEVARIDSNKWAITARGFNGRFANKMLVLVDGRSVYTPLFSGVYWDSLDTELEDIERIEVIRGPGATMWGANAVNGVINIITRKSEDTQGLLMSGGGGNAEQGFGGVRYGGRMGERGTWRAYSKFHNRGSFTTSDGKNAEDQWNHERGGFRADWRNSHQDSFMVEGDAFRGSAGTGTGSGSVLLFDSISAAQSRGANILGRWHRDHSGQSSSELQVYFDRTIQSVYGVEEARNTLDLDFQHAFAPHRGHQFLVGVGYRFSEARLRLNPRVAFDPVERADNLVSGFVQDEISIAGDRLVLTVGSKFEHNNYTGAEIQPGVRLEWAISQRHTAWGAVARAVRTPSERDVDMVRLDLGVTTAPNGMPALVQILGNRNFESESMVAHELGYRVQAGERLWIDLAAFHNRYAHLSAPASLPPSFAMAPFPHLVVPTTFTNLGSARTYGGETTVTWAATGRWKLAGSYGLFKGNKKNDDLDSGFQCDPRHQFNVRSYLNLPGRWTWDVMMYHVGTVESISGVSNAMLPRYQRWDTRLGRRLGKGVEVTLAVENLQGGHHVEQDPEAFGWGSRIGRSAYLKLTWRREN